MKQFVTLLAVVGSSLAAPAADPEVHYGIAAAVPYINQGTASGPLTPAVGDLVATPNGYRSVTLEGFSEDLNEDGFVDPIAQAVVPVVQQAPLIAASPVATYHAAPVVNTKVVAAAPAVHTYTVPAATTKVVAAPAPVATYAVLDPPGDDIGCGLCSKVVAAPSVATYAVPRAPAVAYTHQTISRVPAVVQHVGYNFQQVPQVAPLVGAAFNNALYVPTVVSPVDPNGDVQTPAVEEA